MKILLSWIFLGFLFLSACENLNAPDRLRPSSPNNSAPENQDEQMPSTPGKTESPRQLVTNASRANPPETERSPVASHEMPPEEMPAGVVIIFRLSGGFAGADEKWNIYADGRIVDKNAVQSQATGEQVAALLAQIESMGFFELEERYVPDNTCCDRFTYVLTVQSNNKTHTVTALEAEAGTPQALWNVIQAVSQFIKGTNP